MAIALPIPRVPPVTKAVLFSNENRDVILGYRLRSDLVPNVVSTEWMIFEYNSIDKMLLVTRIVHLNSHTLD